MNALNPFWSVTLFWIAALVCVLIALAFVLPPLLRRREAAAAKAARRDINIAVYRDQLKEMENDRANGLLSEEQFQTAKLELEARLAEDALAQADRTMTPVASRRLGYGLAGLLPAAAFGLYFVLGNPMSLTAIAEAQANPQQVVGGHDIMKMIQQVEERTRTNPEDGQAWTLLAKTYAAVGHWPEALHAYEKAYALRPDVPAVMTGYAEALAISNNRVLKGKPIELVMQALEKDPLDLKGLELAGIAAFQEKGYAKAAFYFKHLYKQLPPESPYAQDILEAQKEAERLMRGAQTGGLDDLSDPKAGEAKQEEARIHGKVDIAAALKGKVGANDTIFLFARGAEGKPPVAALRAPASAGLPLEFELNDGMAMSPDNRLSKFKEVTLVARISKSGDPKGAPGDFEGELKAVKVGAKDVRLVIDKVKP